MPAEAAAVAKALPYNYFFVSLVNNKLTLLLKNSRVFVYAK